MQDKKQMESTARQSKSVQYILLQQFNEMRVNAIVFRDFLLIVVLRSAAQRTTRDKNPTEMMNVMERNEM